MAVGFSNTNKPLNPRGQDASPKGYNRAKLFSGKALDFDGVNDNIVASSFNGLSGEAKASISLYFNFDSISSGDNWFIAQDNPTNRVFAFGYTGASKDLRLQIIGANSTGLNNYSFNTNEWYHCVLTFDTTTNAVVVYVNGQQVATGTQTNDIPSATSDLYVGQREYTGAVGRVNGQITNAKVFNTALTAAQVADLYNNPEKVVPTGVDNTALKLWLPMQEGAGTTAYDGSGNGNHGTINGATWTHGIGAPVSQTAVIDWNKGTNLLQDSEEFDTANWSNDGTLTSGQTAPDGSATAYKIVFSNVNSYLQNTTGGLDTSADYTLSCWVKSDGADTDFYMGNLNFGSYETRTATSEWQRFEVTQIPSATTRYPRPVDSIDGTETLYIWGASLEQSATAGPYVRTGATAQTSPVLLPQGLTTGRDITGVNLFENVRKQGALNLDGNSWAEVHDNESLDFGSGSWTAECWVYWDGTSSGDGILGRWYTTERAMLFFTQSGSYFRLFTGRTNGSADYDVSSSTISVGWRHIVGTYDSSDTKLRIYIDGALDVTSAAFADAYNSNAQSLEIGRFNNSTTGTYTNSIAQPRIYNRALTAEEVARNYDAGRTLYQ